MGLYFGILITLTIIVFIANALVDGYVDDKNINKWVMIICKAIVCIILFGGLILLSKCGCSLENEYTPSGESTLEHYEPR